MAFVLCFAAVSRGLAQTPPNVVVPPGFTVAAFDAGVEVTGIVAGTGMWGHDAYFCTQYGGVSFVDFSPLQSGTLTGSASISLASGLAFESGVFGTEVLYVSADSGVVYSVNPAGNVTTFSSGGALFGSNDLISTPQFWPFPAALVVTNDGTIALVDQYGISTTFVPSTAFAAPPLGVDFPPPYSAFGTDLYATVYGDQLLRITPAGAVTGVASGLGDACGMAFTGPGSFGDAVYVSDGIGEMIWRIAPNGAKTLFATGLSVGATGWGADLSFSAARQTLYVASGNYVLAIAGSCGAGQANGAGASLGVNGYGIGTCAGPQTAYLAAPGPVTLSVAGPPNSPFVVGAGPINPAGLAIGCPGLLHIGTPPALTDIVLVFDGFNPPGPSNPFHTDASGSFQLSGWLLPIPSGALTTIQAAVLQPVGSPCWIMLSEALLLTIP